MPFSASVWCQGGQFWCGRWDCHGPRNPDRIDHTGNTNNRVIRNMEWLRGDKCKIADHSQGKKWRSNWNYLMRFFSTVHVFMIYQLIFLEKTFGAEWALERQLIFGPMALLVQFQPVGWNTLTTLITFDFGVMVPRNALTVRRRKYILLDIQ